MYKTTFKEAEKEERRAVNEQVRQAKKEIRDKFLDEFYLPLRREYEENIQKYD